MKVLDIVLILIIILVILLMIRYKHILINKNNKNNKETFGDGCLEDDRDTYYIDKLLTYTQEDIDKNTNKIFVPAQYNNDYRDVMSAFYEISPNQKQIFNQANAPIEYNNPNVKEVSKLIKDFLKEINIIIRELPDVRNKNTNWIEPLVDPNIRTTGWEKQMEALGLPKNLYPDPARNATVRLIAISHVEKYSTDIETKYVCYLYLQKKNVDTQLVVRVSFVLNNRDINVDRNFFDNEMDKVTFKPDSTNVIIEDIFIEGYLTTDGLPLKNYSPDHFYNFDKLDHQNILDAKTIIQALREKYRLLVKDDDNFKKSLDNESRKFQDEIPSLANFKSYQQTYDIYSDLENKNKYYS